MLPSIIVWNPDFLSVWFRHGKLSNVVSCIFFVLFVIFIILFGNFGNLTCVKVYETFFKTKDYALLWEVIKEGNKKAKWVSHTPKQYLKL